MAATYKAPIPFPEDLTGRNVGRFAIRHKLGAGGMGEVWYAEDTKLKRPVALKRLTRKLGSGPQTRRRILREAQRASALSSEHIAGVHDVVEENGELFLVMEYVEGETLRCRLERPLTLEQFFEVATQCTEALASAHRNAIVHCDVKPENIMLTPEGQVKILDFGLAKHLPRSDQSSTLDCTGFFGGTPAYMAPEVLREHLPDARSDIFSLGVVLYEMLTLQHPFCAHGFVATSERILHETPAPVRTFNSSVPEALEAIVMKAMAKAPKERYAEAHELLQELREVQAGKRLNKLWPTVKRRLKGRAGRWVFAAIVTISIVAVLFTRWMNREPILGERGWVLISDFVTSGDNSIPSLGIREGLVIALQQSRYLNVFPRTRTNEVLQRMKKDGATRIDETLGREICQRENLRVLLTGTVDRFGPVFQITVRAVDPASGSLLFAERERFDQEGQFFEKTDALATRIRRNLGESLDQIKTRNRPLAKVTTPSLEALQLYSEAKDTIDRGKNEQVPVLLKGALRLDPNFAMAHLQLGEYYLAVVGKNEKAAEELQWAYWLRQDVTDREQLRIEGGYYNLEEQYDDEAQALSILVSLYPDDEEAHWELAGAYYDLHQLDEALIELRRALRINPVSAPAYRSLVLYLAYDNQFEAAIAAGHEAQQHGVNPPQMHWGLGLAYLGLGNTSAARQEFVRIGEGTETDRELEALCLVVADLYEGKLSAAKASLVAQVQPEPAQSRGLQAFRYYLLGRIYLNQGNTQGAALQADLITRVPNSALQVSDLLNAGVLYARAGRIDASRRVLRLIEESQKQFPSSSSRSNFHNLEGEILLAEARLEEAEHSLSAAVQEHPRVLPSIGLAAAYQAQRRWQPAAAKWEQVLRCKGEILHNGFPPDLAYAHLQLGRLCRRLKKPETARGHYEELLQMWPQADELRVLKDAKRELNELKSELNLNSPQTHQKWPRRGPS